MTQRQVTRNGFFNVGLAVVLTIVILVLISGSLVYYFRSSKNQPQAVSAKVQKPQIPVVSKPQSASQNQLTINELGIKVQVPAQLAGLTYTVTRANSSQGTLVTVQLALPAYSNLANKCAGLSGNTTHPFANLSKATKASGGSSVIKDMGDYVIVNSGSSVPPGVTCKDPAVQSQLKNLGDQLTTELASMFQGAQKI